MDQQSLLRWGIENAAPGALLAVGEEQKLGRRPDLNSAMLKHIMGKSNADRMVEAMEVIQGRWIETDETTGKSVDRSAEITEFDQLTAWDDLEMLIEDLDNANDLKFLKLWEPIIKGLSSENDEIRMRACWVCGTAVQNNPRAQEAFLEYDPLPIIHALILSTASSAATRSKAMYCLSATLKHSHIALKRFDELEGWSVLNKSLNDPSTVLRTKTAFLLSSMILQSTHVPSTSVAEFGAPPPLEWSTKQFVTRLRKYSVLSTLIQSISSSALPTGPNGDVETVDADYTEKALRVLVNIVSLSGQSAFTASEKTRIQHVVAELERGGLDLEELGLAQSEWAEFKLGLE